MSKAKFFVALIPPEPLAGEIMAWKEEFNARFNSKAALRSPAHLTLHMPFEWPEKRNQELLSVFGQTAKATAPFQIQLKGFGAFPPRVIYVAVTPSQELSTFQQAVNEQARKQLYLLHPTHNDRGFHPHLTVAFRDLRKIDFPTAWDLVVDAAFDKTWTANELALLRHDGKCWQVWERLPFGPSSK